MQNVRRWLASIGMSQHADLFAANRIDSAVLPDLTDHDLEKLGLVLGDRRKPSANWGNRHDRVR